MVERMAQTFRTGHYEDGLTHALAEVSTVLVQHFPLAAGEVRRNEQPDEPTLG